MAFSLNEQSGFLEVLFSGQPVVEFINEHLWFRGFRIDNARLRPGGPVECIGLFASCFYAQAYLRADWVATVLSPSAVQVVITPAAVDQGLARVAQETRTITIRHDAATDRFSYEVDVALTILADMAPGMEHVWLSVMDQWGDDDYAILEFEDPLLGGGKGPQVPMTQDWRGIQEPWFHEHCFTRRWRKRYRDAVLHTAERGWRRLALHRVQTGAQLFYNRHVLRCEPGTTFYYTRDDGQALAIRHEHPYDTGHHVCEWGMDIHVYALLPKARPDCWFAAGQSIAVRYVITEVAQAEMPAAARAAEVAGLEPHELANVDLPIYEEPVCGFAESALDHPDAGAWRLAGSGHWQRSGARLADHGALVLEPSDAAATSTWSFAYLGPSHGANPIPPLSRHRVSAWVRADDLDAVALELVWTHFAGPGMYSARQDTSHVLDRSHIVESAGDWHRLELATPPGGSYVLAGRLAFRYAGSGQAALTELSIARI